MRARSEGSAAVTRDLSDTGLLLVTERQRWPGERLAIEVVLGDERVALAGDVVRSLAQPGEEYPEYLAAIRLDAECAAAARDLASVAERIDELVNGRPGTE